MSTTTSAFSAFALEPFPTIARGDDLAAVITGVLSAQATDLQDGDVIVVASKWSSRSPRNGSSISPA